MSATAIIDLRSALFPSSDTEENRPYVEAEEIYRSGGVTALFTGQRLDRSDLGVYLELVRLADGHPLGCEAIFSADSLLKALGRDAESNRRARLHDSIIRLCGGILEISDGAEGYFSGLLNGGTLDEDTGIYEVSVNMRLAIFITTGHWSNVGHGPRQAPKRQGRAKAAGLLN